MLTFLYRLFFISLISIIGTSALGQTTYPKGLPTVKSDSGSYQIGYLNPKVYGVITVGDTAIRPNINGASRLWFHSGVDTCLWSWSNTTWIKMACFGSGGVDFYIDSIPGVDTCFQVITADTVYNICFTGSGSGGGGGGSGTVDSVSSGNLSPLFTTSVATATTTPALTFTASSVSPYTLYGRASGSGVPSFLSSIDSLWVPALHSQTYYDSRYQPIGNYITALTGDITASGPGSAAATLATVNSNVGTFGSATQVAQVTVNAKGLTTAASNITITPAATSITGAGDLTKTDDTNVTMTLGGTPTGALLKATSMTLGWTGTLGVARGGTNISSYTTGDLLYASGSTTISKLSIGTTAQHLVVVGGVPVWRDTAASGSSITPAALTKVDDTNITLTLGGTPSTALLQATSITAGWSGQLSIARGGTNSGTALSGSSIMVSNGSAVVQGAAGTTTTLLHGNASGTPTYSAVSLTADVSGNLPVANGGTANSSFTAYSPIYAGTTSTGAFQSSTLGTNGTVLTSTGTGSLPTWQSPLSIDSLAIHRNIAASSIYTTGGGTGGTSATGQNTLIGLGTGGGTTGNAPNRNTATGYFALNALTTGNDNTAIGMNALVLVQSGVNNTAVGMSALSSLPAAGVRATAVGKDALKLNTANDATAFGYGAGSTQTSQTGNTWLGNTVNGNATPGNNNTASGLQVLYNNTGTGNTGTGWQAIYTKAAGDYNTAMGMSTMFSQTSGGYNIGIGSWIDMPSLSGSSQLNIGNVLYGTGMYATASNSSTPTTGGALSVGITAPAASAILDLTSTAKGLLVPRMTTAQRDAISSPATGLMIFNTTLNTNDVYDGTRWVSQFNGLSGSATLDFGSTLAGAVTDLTVTCTGAADGDAVMLGVPNGSYPATGTFTAWVSSANTCTIRYANNSLTLTQDPASGVFKVSVRKN